MQRRAYAARVRSTPVVTVSCADCGDAFELASRNARRHRHDGTAPRCATCRGLARMPQPSEEDRQFWLERLGIEEERQLAGMIWPAG